jgi:hypothetical protein
VPYLVFAWTTPALLAGAKTVYRVPSTDRRLARWRAGMLVTAYDRPPHKGGHPVAVLQLAADPVLEPLSAMPDSDYEAEGWHWLHEHRALLPRWITASDFGPEAFQKWRSRTAQVWVVRFRLVAVATGDEAAEALAEPTAAQPVAA